MNELFNDVLMQNQKENHLSNALAFESVTVMLIITQAQHILTYLRFATVVLQNI
jgi:hypothetical protein